MIGKAVVFVYFLLFINFSVYDCTSQQHWKEQTLARKKRQAVPGLLIESIPVTVELQQDFVSAHNFYRSIVGPQASNMRQMSWDEELAALAQEHAELCVFAHNVGASTTAFPAVGENIWLAFPGGNYGNRSTEKWNREVEWYDYENDICAESQQCGHYTQVVWATSEKLGCGISHCGPTVFAELPESYIVVCNYGPPGNNVGEKPYKTGTPCAQCDPAITIGCQDNLCIRKQIAPTASASPSPAVPSSELPVSEPPFVSTNPPLSSSEPPLSSSEPPFASSESPLSSSEPPFASTEPPFSSSEPPFASSVSPLSSSEPPFASSESPLSSSESPFASTEPPFSSSEPPFASSVPPFASSELLLSSSEIPFSSSEPYSTSYSPPSTSYPPPSTSYPPPSTSYPSPSTSYPPPSTSYPTSPTSYPPPSTSYPSTTGSQGVLNLICQVHDNGLCSRRSQWLCEYIRWRVSFLQWRQQILAWKQNYSSDSQWPWLDDHHCRPLRVSCESSEMLRVSDDFPGCWIQYCQDGRYADIENVMEIWEDDFKFWQNYQVAWTSLYNDFLNSL